MLLKLEITWHNMERRLRWRIFPTVDQQKKPRSYAAVCRWGLRLVRHRIVAGIDRPTKSARLST